MRAHQGPAASQATRALGAEAYAFGNSVAFGSSPDLPTAAHEAAHVVQQRGVVQLKAGIDQPGDAYERHDDAVAEVVVAGGSAALLLDNVPGGGRRGDAVQRTPAPHPSPAAATAASANLEITPPTAGIDKPGFIDNSEGRTSAPGRPRPAASPRALRRCPRQRACS